jgi:uncharacterized protein
MSGAGSWETTPPYAADLRRILLANAVAVEVLRAVRELELANAVVGGGAVRNLVWDALSGRQATTFRDIDVAYFDPSCLSPRAERRAEERLARRLPAYEWQVKNQAAVHLWYERRFARAVEPLESLEAAVATWPETATAVAVSLETDDTVRVVAPFGLEDLFEMVWRHNPTRATREAYEQRLADKRPQERWPAVRIVS